MVRRSLTLRGLLPRTVSMLRLKAVMVAVMSRGNNSPLSSKLLNISQREVALKALATIQDLEARNISAEPQAIAEALLDAVSASIRDAAGSPISLTKSTITEIGAPSQWLPVNVYAPRTPTAVNIDG